MDYFAMPTTGQMLAILFAFVLSALIGAERELRHKDAGMRTHVLVGVGSCLFTLVSIGGFPADLTGNLRWDGSRIAAQIVSGIGFIGAGVIWFHHDAIRGLTTASAIWVAAAIGMACGAEMFSVAITVVLAYFLLVLAIAPLFHWITKRTGQTIQISYEGGRGILRELLLEISKRGFGSEVLSSRRLKSGEEQYAQVNIRLKGSHDLATLVSWLSEFDGVREVQIADEVE